MKYLIASLLLLQVLSQMQLVPVPEEIPKIEISKLADAPKKDNTLYVTEKVFEINSEGYGHIQNSFKNVVFYVYKDEDQKFIDDLEGSIKLINPKENKIDVIFLKGIQEQFEKLELGLHIKHHQQTHHFTLDDIKTKGTTQLAKLLKDIIAPSIGQLSTIEEVDQFLLGDEVKLLLVMEKEHTLYPKVQEQFEQWLKDGYLTEAGVKQLRWLDKASYNQYKSPSLLLYKPNSALERYEYNITFFDQIGDFIYLESLPIIVPLEQQYLARVFGGSTEVNINHNFHLLLDEEEANTGLLEEYRKAAKHNKEEDLKYQRIIFTYSNYLANKDLFTQFDFTEATRPPQLVVTRTNFRKFQLEKYLYDENELTEEAINRFAERYRERNVTQFFRSEPTPFEALQDGVVKVVGNTFTNEIIKGKMNTVVLYWDSKNPHVSQEHEKILRQLGKELPEEQREFLKIVTFDLALNEHPKIVIDSAPQLYLYLAGDKRRPKEYNLDIEIGQIKAWLSYWVTDLELVKFDPNGSYVVLDLEELKQKRKQANLGAIKPPEEPIKSTAPETSLEDQGQPIKIEGENQTDL